MSEDLIVRQAMLGDAGATFSPCMRYRYLLWRQWAPTPVRWLNMVMLNPSTANEMVNDPTVERCERRAAQWGFDGLLVTNIFAWRSTDPLAMYGLKDPVGPANDAVLVDSASRSTMVVCAWGNHGKLRGRSTKVRELLTNFQLHALKVSRKTGEPWHPLYMGYSVEPFEWK